VLTLVRLLAGVGSDVYGQGTPLDEALSASRSRARVWPLVGMDPVVSLQVRLAVEALHLMVNNYTRDCGGHEADTQVACHHGHVDRN
jgi:hypothetical protein